MAEKKRPDPGRTLDLLWRGDLVQFAGRGPKPKLTLREIVDAGIRVADAHGLEALSMRRVAEDLGVGTMSLYTYVPGRAELLHLMLDHATGETPPLPPGTGWREALRHYARLGRDLATAHPWTLYVSGPGLQLMGPRTTARSEAVYAALTGLGLSGREMASIAGSVEGYVRGVCLGAADIETQTRQSGIDYEQWWAEATPHLTVLITRERFPTLYGLWESGTFEDEPDAVFDFGLDRLLDGIEHHLARR